MTFSENQVRQLYVATEVKDPSTSSAKLGAIKAKFDKNKETIWFDYKGAGGRVASDKIKVSNIISAKAIKSTHMDVPLKRYKVTLDGAVIPGQDYILRIVFDHFIGMTENDQYVKYGVVRGASNMEADKFYKTLAISIAKNMSREVNNMVNVYAHSTSITASTGSGAAFDKNGLVLVKSNFTVEGGKADAKNNWYNGTSGAATDIDYLVLEEVEQPWVRGKMAVEKIPFNVYPGVITNADSNEVIWGKVTEDKTVNFIKSGKIIADLEYFLMGERGDIYRGMGYPNNIETTYMVDGLNHNYDVLDITYFYAGNNEDIQKSQKTITIVADNAGASTLINAVVADVNTATGDKPHIADAD